MIPSIIFTVCLIVSNILETKQMVFGPLHLTGGLLIFPVSYIVNHVVCEVWGYRRTSILIWTGFITNFCFMAVASLADAIPGAPYWDNEAGVHAIFGLTPRIALASFVSFIASSFVNAYVMSRMKISDNGKRFPLRAIVSTILVCRVVACCTLYVYKKSSTLVRCIPRREEKRWWTLSGAKIRLFLILTSFFALLYLFFSKKRLNP